MVISIASGKGGTGKTTVSIAIAQSLDTPINLIDCDVEEPNIRIFLPIEIKSTEIVYSLIPKIDEDRCLACGKCSKICQFNAIANLMTKAMVFPELCHSCGGCIMVCPNRAITEMRHAIGEINFGESLNLNVIEGRLKIGQIMAPHIIKQAKTNIEKDKINIIDSPPGTACAMVTAVKDADYVILVTESTPFGLNDLILAIDTLKELDLPFGVIINKNDNINHLVEDYCTANKINLIAKIPDDMKIAKAYSEGKTLIDVKREFKEIFQKAIHKIIRKVEDETVINNQR